MKTTRCIAAAALLACTGSALALPVTFTSTGANGRAAEATFDVSGSSLFVTLTNTSAIDAGVPTDILTGVFFSVSGGALTLTRTSAELNAGSIVTNGGGTDPFPLGVGGEWAYKSGFAAVNGATYGISSTGLGIFGPGDRFPGADLEPPTSPNGVEYGITTAGDNPATGNGGILNVPLIKNSVKFVLTGLPANFDLARINNVWLQYGTDLSEPRDPGVPAPGAAVLLGLGGLMAARRRRA